MSGHCCFGEEPAALCSLCGAGGAVGHCRSCSTARGCGSSDPPAQGPPGTHGPALPLTCAANATLQPAMSSALNLSWWDLPVPSLNLSVDGHFYWASRYLGEEQRGLSGHCCLSKPTPVAKGHCALWSLSGTCRVMGAQTGQCHGHRRERQQGNTPVRKQGGSCWCQCPPLQHQINSENTSQRNAAPSLGGLGV